MPIVLDTNVISESLKSRSDERVVRYLKPRGKSTWLTAITRAELLYGVRALPDGERKSSLIGGIDRILRAYESRTLPFDSPAADIFADLKVETSSKGRDLSMADLQIAAICVANNLVLATRNVRDFEETGVRIVNPWKT